MTLKDQVKDVTVVDTIQRKDVLDKSSIRANQWVGLTVDTSMKDRVDICSQFDQFCDGGSVCHLNVDGEIKNKDTSWELLNYVAKSGVPYFALNGKISQDDDNHIFYGNTCPHCGKPKTSEFSRVVGFYVNTKSFSEPRKQEFLNRKWY